MEPTISDAGPFEKIVTFEVEEARLDQAKNQAARKLSREMKIPGFRPGKAPRRVVEAAVGADRLRAEAIDDALAGLVNEALDATDLQLAAVPSLDSVEDTESGIEISVKVALWPTLETTPEYVGREIAVPSPIGTDEDIAEQIDRMRDQFAELEPADRPCQEGDYASIDLSAKADGEEIPEASAQGLMVAVGSSPFIEGLDEAVLGMSAGETKDFDSTLPESFGDRGGEPATFTIAVTDVQGKSLPEMTDEWISEVTEFDSVAAFRKEVERRISESKAGASWDAFRNELITALIDEIDLEIPAAIINAEMEEVLHRFSHTLGQQGIEMDDYLQISGQTQEAFVEDLRATAARNVRTDLLLDAVADDAGLEVGDEEFVELLSAMAAQTEQTLEELREGLTENQEKNLRGDILRRKAHEALLKAAVPVDDAGNPIDFEALAAATAPAPVGDSLEDSDRDEEEE